MKVRIDRKKRIWLLWAVPVLTAVALGGAQGAPAMGRGPGNGPPFLMRLELSEAQKAELRQKLPPLQAEQKALQERMDAMRPRLQSLRQAESFDEQAVRQVFQEMAPLMEDMAVQRARFMFAVKAVLTPEQLAKIEARRAERPGRRGAMRARQAAMWDTWLQMPAAGSSGAGQP